MTLLVGDDLIRPTFESLRLTNFLSYKAGDIRFGGLVALVGPNASGKSNAVAAMKLLREIPLHGLPVAIARRGGFDQLRHRSSGRPNDPALRLTFRFDSSKLSHYEIRFGAVAGKRYEVKHESASLYYGRVHFGFESDGHTLQWTQPTDGGEKDTQSVAIAPGQSALSAGGGLATFLVARALGFIQTVEINPAHVGDLQQPSSTSIFEPDGSNTVSMYEALDSGARTELVDQLAAIVPGIVRIDVRNLADRQTLTFVQETDGGRREFLAKQMSDGTLRAFSILLATFQQPRPSLLVIEEPEIAIHLGALRTLVDILKDHSTQTQILITTHSADIVDSLSIDSLRVVWTSAGSSRIAPVADHTKAVVRDGLITPGQLLRSDSLDPKT